MAHIVYTCALDLGRDYPIAYFDALRLKIRDEGTVKSKAMYMALGIGRWPQGGAGPVDRAYERRQVLTEGL